MKIIKQKNVIRINIYIFLIINYYNKGNDQNL